MFDTPDRTGLIADEIHARAMAREASRKGDAEGRAYWIDRADKISAMIDALADVAAPAYRTGVAYAWKGGECPVAPDARVVLRYRLPRDQAHVIAPRTAHPPSRPSPRSAPIRHRSSRPISPEPWPL